MTNELEQRAYESNTGTSETSTRQGKKFGLIAGVGALALAGTLAVGGYVFCKTMGEIGAGLAEKVYIDIPNSLSD